MNESSPFDNELMNKSPYADAIASIESEGSGGYAALGPMTRSGDRAYGRYQVMGANIPAWTRAATGKSLSPEEFLKDRGAQDAVFNHRFGQYAAEYGPAGAASMWFSGRPSSNARDITGTSDGEYVRRFLSAMQGGHPNLLDDNRVAKAAKGVEALMGQGAPPAAAMAEMMKQYVPSLSPLVDMEFEMGKPMSVPGLDGQQRTLEPVEGNPFKGGRASENVEDLRSTPGASSVMTPGEQSMLNFRRLLRHPLGSLLGMMPNANVLNSPPPTNYVAGNTDEAQALAQGYNVQSAPWNNPLGADRTRPWGENASAGTIFENPGDIFPAGSVSDWSKVQEVPPFNPSWIQREGAL